MRCTTVPISMRLPESMMELAGVGAGTAAVSYLVGWLVFFGLRRWQIIDVPNARSSHSRPTPRGGGLGIIATFLAATALLASSREGAAWLVFFTVGGLALVSFLDDRLRLSWRLRLGGHLVAAALGAFWLRPEVGMAACWVVPILVLLLAGHANAFNFMDGINGLAAGQAVVVALGLAVLAVGSGGAPLHPAGLLALALAGAAAGFLPHNFPRARMFMGDVGSVPIGFALMLLAVWLAHDRGPSLWVPLLAIQSGFILDTGLTLVRRWRSGAALHEAHREHFYQRLVRAGWSHPSATGSFLAVSSGVSVAALVLARSNWSPVWAVAVCSVGWGGYFAVCETVFRARSRN